MGDGRRPDDRTEEAAEHAVEDEPQGGAAEWLWNNTEYEGHGIVVRQHADPPPAVVRGEPNEPRHDHGNLYRLPQGATFGTDQRPSAEEAERLMRFAAGAQGEMQDAAAAREQDTGGQHPQGQPDDEPGKRGEDGPG